MYQNSLLQSMIIWKWLPIFFIKWKQRGRQQDSGETERECVLAAEHCGERKIALEIK
jgi:hypothetical protein